MLGVYLLYMQVERHAGCTPPGIYTQGGMLGVHCLVYTGRHAGCTLSGMREGGMLRREPLLLLRKRESCRAESLSSSLGKRE